MPRRRASGQTDSNRIKQRVRTGCKTCRTRRVKCDETKPQCRNCLQRGLACDNSVQLKWEQEFADRGLAFGREGRWSKSQKPQSEASYTNAEPASVVERCSFPFIQVHLFINFGYWDFDNRFEAGRECGDMLDVEGTSEECESAQVVTWPISPTPCAYPSLANIDSHLLDYFLIRLCPLTTSSRLTPSPFAQLVIPLFSIPGQDDILRAVLALSARHRCIGDLQWSRSAMNLKGEVITSLRKRLLSAETPESDSSWDPQILVIMMFLCLYEIVDNCDHRWVIHLRASKEIIQRSRQLKATHFGKDFGGLTAFTERFFAFQDVISRTACGNSALFGVEYWADADQPGHIDSWMGCSPDLVSILCRIAEVSRLKTGDDISADFLERESAELEQRLEAMQVRTDDRSSDDDALLLAAELKRKSVLLYHHCVLYDACPSTPFVCQLKRDILEGICELVEAGLAAGLAFPIFVAAVELHPTDDQEFLDKRTGELVCGRRLVLETLEVMAKLSLSNISRTRAVIQKVWRMRDMALEDCHSLSLRTGVNDWSIFVGPYSANISLS
ncbi:fungal-specific transcription factor domain-containing protein [Talaromyces proteolyticus]|uniref:Fungal-specific transcription factor domain-containing protein n=1 Tax=Talaromyces proteolyticus TaxID=1131652 RepID=A0AAD4KHP1_9EURO|nr:fungal-specific transcription factor domain-containing protein [Talaromyces proteolyticus]KAH8691442.1 fungal-specific transcription factor domain-containing protein [Talaromyces proteolyticus]